MAIRYGAQAYQGDNEAMISKAGIRHNKFLVLIHRDEPVAMWTGSTNISAGGVLGHSNVGRVIGDKSVALKFLDYWGRLADPDVTRQPI